MILAFIADPSNNMTLSSGFSSTAGTGLTYTTPPGPPPPATPQPVAALSTNATGTGPVATGFDGKNGDILLILLFYVVVLINEERIREIIDHDLLNS